MTLCRGTLSYQDPPVDEGVSCGGGSSDWGRPRPAPALDQRFAGRARGAKAPSSPSTGPLLSGSAIACHAAPNPKQEQNEQNHGDDARNDASPRKQEEKQHG